MNFLFDTERRIRCKAAHERDLATTVPDEERRRRHLERALQLSRLLPGSRGGID